MSLYKKFLYQESFCSYRQKDEEGIKCMHPYGFGVCDLELGPIVQDHFANVVFKPEGIQLIIKEPSEEMIGGSWKEEELEIQVGEENNQEEIIEEIKAKTNGITEENRTALIERVNDIFKHYEFLRENNNLPGILQEEVEEEITGAREGVEEEVLEEEEESIFEEESKELFKEEADEETEENSKEQDYIE